MAPTSDIDRLYAEIRTYLDGCIEYWRDKRAGATSEEIRTMAIHYIDAFQSTRITIFGETLPPDDDG
jgi:hypothetical protein